MGGRPDCSAETVDVSAVEIGTGDAEVDVGDEEEVAVDERRAWASAIVPSARWREFWRMVVLD